MNKTLMIIIAVVVIFAGIIMSGYNNLVSMNENVNGKWSQVENQLQRRNDLIPNLVNTVKGYAAHESDVFKAVSDARAKLGGAKTVAETSQANGELSSALSRLLMIAENYPDLKANTNFLQLQDELAGTENRIAVARMDYNGAVQASTPRSNPSRLFFMPVCSVLTPVITLKQTKAQKLFRKYNFNR